MVTSGIQCAENDSESSYGEEEQEVEEASVPGITPNSPMVRWELQRALAILTRITHNTMVPWGLQRVLAITSTRRSR